MPTVKPRITVTLNQHVYDVFDRLAQLQGTSKGAVIAEILETVYPPLMRTVALLEAANEAPKQVRQGLKSNLEALERDLMKSQEGSAVQLDWMIHGLREGAAAASDPPQVTRGSGSQNSLASGPSKIPANPATARVSRQKRGG